MPVIDDHDLEPEGPPAAADDRPVTPPFWPTYNANLELPTAGLLSALFVALLAAGLFGLLLLASAGRKDTKAVPIALVSDGEDDFGQGMRDVGGFPEPAVPGDSTPSPEDFQELPTPNDQPLPEVIKEVQDQIKLDQDLASEAVTPEKAAAYAGLAESLRDKLQPGRRKGNNPKGTNQGAEGTGADATKARSLRWVIRFKTVDGRDYLAQLAAFGAVVVVPVPPDNKSAYVFRDLADPKPGQLVSEPEWHALAEQVQFCDFRPANVAMVAQALGVADTRPTMFWAFFPKNVEERLAAMERAHQGLPPEQVSETVFAVVQNAGRYDLQVVRQKTK